MLSWKSVHRGSREGTCANKNITYTCARDTYMSCAQLVSRAHARHVSPAHDLHFFICACPFSASVIHWFAALLCFSTCCCVLSETRWRVTCDLAVTSRDLAMTLLFIYRVKYTSHWTFFVFCIILLIIRQHKFWSTLFWKKHWFLFSCITFRKSTQFDWKFQTK